MSRKLIPLLLLLACEAQPQAIRGAITGVVKDSTGAVIPDVSVTVRNEQTGSTTVAKSQTNGVCVAPQLLPGDYVVSAEHAGFRRLEISGLKVDVGTTLTQDLVFELGAVSEKVEVTGQTSLVETTSGQVGTTVQISHVSSKPATWGTSAGTCRSLSTTSTRSRLNCWLEPRSLCACAARTLHWEAISPACRLLRATPVCRTATA